MGAPSDQFLHIPYGAPLRPVSLHTLSGPLRQFLCLLAPPPRSVSLLTIWGLPQINFFTYYVGAPSDQFLCTLYRGPPQVSVFAYYMGPPQVSFFTYYRGSLRSVSLHTIWGPPSDQFLYLLNGGSSVQCLRLIRKYICVHGLD